MKTDVIAKHSEYVFCLEKYTFILKKKKGRKEWKIKEVRKTIFNWDKSFDHSNVTWRKMECNMSWLLKTFFLNFKLRF